MGPSLRMTTHRSSSLSSAESPLTPSTLLEPLRDKVQALAEEQRFEEAAWVRDRYQTLARAIERRRAWLTLEGAGRIWAESPDGAACIDNGRLVAAWVRGTTPPLIPPYVEPEQARQVPGSIAEAEESHLVWRWLTATHTKLLESTHPLSTPAHPVPELSLAA